MTILLAFAAASAMQSVPPPIVTIQQPSMPAPAPPMVRPVAPPIMLDIADFSADAGARVQALNNALKARIMPANERSLKEMNAAVEAFRDATRTPIDRDRLLAAADANDRVRHIPEPANRRWVELALSLAPADRDRLLKSLPTPSGQLFIRQKSRAAETTGAGLTSGDASMKAMRALRDALSNPTPERVAAKAEENRTLRVARALAADPTASREAIMAAFTGYGDARAALNRYDTVELGRLIAGLPVDQRLVLLDLLAPSVP